jgi:PAS domain S-box-containing protein
MDRPFFDENPLPMWVFDADSLAFLAVNRAAIAQYGYSREEFLAMTLRDIGPPEDPADLDPEFARLERGEIASYQADRRYVRRDGAIAWARVTVSLARAERRARAAMAVVEDVSARRRSAEALRRRTDRLAAIVDAQQEIAAATLDLDTALPRLLERAQAVTGANAAAIGRVGAGEVVYEVATGSAAPHAPFRTALDASLSGAALRAGRLLRCDDAETDPHAARDLLRRLGSRSAAALPLVYNGATLGVLLVAAPTVGAFGEDEAQALHLFGGMLAAAMSHARELDARQRTIAERTAALAALRDREEQYRLVTDGVPLLISYVDAEQRYRFVNRAYELAFGVTRDQLVGRRVADLLGDTYPRVRPWIEATHAGERGS